MTKKNSATKRRTEKRFFLSKETLDPIISRCLQEGITPAEFISEAIHLRMQRKRVVRLIETNPVIRMPFGKYEGHPIMDLPTGYLIWARDNATNLNEEVRDEIRAEVAAREEGKNV
jgi:hypothetical protein